MKKLLNCTLSELTMKKSQKIPNIQCEGEIRVKASDLDLDLTLLGGQSFRWSRVSSEVPAWKGVAFDAYWRLEQSADSIKFHVTKLNRSEKLLNNRKACELLRDYFRLDFDLAKHVDEWKLAHSHFASLAPQLKAVRVLSQEPLENILSFICSQNNHIKRISTMINWLCAKYGTRIGNFGEGDEYSFPTLAALTAEGQEQLEISLRDAKFGYRAKFIAQTVAHIQRCGGLEWFKHLQQLPYQEARTELTSLPGIGLKVADCICLMSLGHLEAVPIDTHIYKIAQSSYMSQKLAKVKSVTPKIYDEIAEHFREVYGVYAGWAQAVLFCSGLQQFQDKKSKTSSESSSTSVTQKTFQNKKSEASTDSVSTSATKKKRKK